VSRSSSPLDNSERYYRSFSIATVSQAPKATGLYAWYAKLNAGIKDWELDIVNGSDAGVNRLRSLLKRHTERYYVRELDATAMGAFSETWSGKLYDQTAEVLQSALADNRSFKDNVDYDTKRAPKLQLTLESPDKRLLMVKALEAALPIMSSPIYIGVADCLNTRLSNHAREINRFTSVVIKDPDSRQRLRESRKTSFAVRAIAAGFAPEHLQVWTFNLDELIVDLEKELGGEICDSRVIAEAVEWVLNRWHRPYLGRR
jgi:hypothetical protein